MFGKYPTEVVDMNTHFSDREVREVADALNVISVKIATDVKIAKAAYAVILHVLSVPNAKDVQIRNTKAAYAVILHVFFVPNAIDVQIRNTKAAYASVIIPTDVPAHVVNAWIAKAASVRVLTADSSHANAALYAKNILAYAHATFAVKTHAYA